MALDIGEFRSLVEGNALFKQFTSDQIEKLLNILKGPRELKPNEFLIREGELSENLYLIQKGRFEVLKKEEDSEETHRLSVLESGMSVGEVSLLDSGPRSASVRALENSSVLVIPIKDLDKLSQADLSADIRMKINLAY